MFCHTVCVAAEEVGVPVSSPWPTKATAPITTRISRRPTSCAFRPIRRPARCGADGCGADGGAADSWASGFWRADSLGAHSGAAPGSWGELGSCGELDWPTDGTPD